MADRVCEDTAPGARSFSYGRSGFSKEKQMAFPAGPTAGSRQPGVLWCCSLVQVSWRGWSILCSQGGMCWWWQMLAWCWLVALGMHRDRGCS